METPVPFHTFIKEKLKSDISDDLMVAFAFRAYIIKQESERRSDT